MSVRWNPTQKTMIDQCLATNKSKMFIHEWGIKSVLEIDENTLEFHTRNNRRIVNIQMKYNIGTDSYDFRAIRIRGTNTEEIFNVKDIYVEGIDETFNSIMTPILKEL